MKHLVFGFGLGFFLLMAWAVRFHFAQGERSPRFLALSAASVANIALFGHFVLRRPQGEAWLAVALALFLAAALLFVAAAHASRAARLKLLFDPAAPHAILDSGPYRFIRHPFYASYLLFWTGCALATLHPVNIGYAVLLVPVLVNGARAEERLFAASPLAAAYDAYRRRAGMFWPKLAG
jgi:protein-S-isoprenylcysteine O-methyltransferase Ste14